MSPDELLELSKQVKLKKIDKEKLAEELQNKPKPKPKINISGESYFERSIKGAILRKGLPELKNAYDEEIKNIKQTMKIELSEIKNVDEKNKEK